jgi:hypothetical protein
MARWQAAGVELTAIRQGQAGDRSDFLEDVFRLLRFAMAVHRGWGFRLQRMCHGGWKAPVTEKG